MALQLWLPLIGDLHNQGLLDEKKYLSNNLTYENDGKIGSKSLQFKGDPSQILSFSNIPQKKNNFTWTCWIKQSDRNPSIQYILSQGRDCGSIGFNIYLHNGQINVLLGSGDIKDAANTSYITRTFIIGKTLELNTWYHICCSINNEKVFLYINGELIGDCNLVDITYYNSSNSYFTIGKMAMMHHDKAKYFPFNGYIQDVRVYDNYLSAREVREIYNNPVVHFPLNQIDKSNNLYTGSKNFSGDNWYNINLWMEDGTYNGFTVRKKNTSWGVLTQNKNVNAGEIYTCSLYIKSDTANNFQFYPSLGNTGLKYTEISSSKIGDLDVNKWYRIYKTVKITEDSLMRFGVEPTQKGGTVWICGMKLEKNETPTDWTPAWQDSDTWFDKIEYDTSGYCNNGTVEESTSPQSVSQSVKDNSTKIFSSILFFWKRLYKISKSILWTKAISIDNKLLGERL